jgi:hypothetical protein
MRISKYLFLLSISLAVSNITCKNSNGPLDMPIGGITQTLRDSSGYFIIVSVDPNDWKLNLSPQPSFTIEQNGKFSTFITPAYPNPSSDSISVMFSLSVATKVSFKIIDGNGNVVRTLMDGDFTAGYYRVDWRLNDQSGNRVKAGLYRCTYSWKARVFAAGSNYSQNADVAVSGVGDIQVN